MYSLVKRRVLNKVALWISRVKLIPILKNVNESSLVIDCGANMGDISALFLDKKASVIAFEPDPLAFKMIQKRFLGNKNIECVNKAVHDKAGKFQLYFHTDRMEKDDAAFTVSSSLMPNKNNIDTNHSVEIETIDLDHFISNLGKAVDILKLDVEGAEVDILKKIIKNETYKMIKLILVETHEKKIVGFQKEVDELKSLIEKHKIKNIKLNWI